MRHVSGQSQIEESFKYVYIDTRYVYIYIYILYIQDKCGLWVCFGDEGKLCKILYAERVNWTVVQTGFGRSIWIHDYKQDYIQRGRRKRIIKATWSKMKQQPHRQQQWHHSHLGEGNNCNNSAKNREATMRTLNANSTSVTKMTTHEAKNHEKPTRSTGRLKILHEYIARYIYSKLVGWCWISSRGTL